MQSANLHVVPCDVYYSDDVSVVPTTSSVIIYLRSQWISRGDIVYFACFEQYRNNGCFVFDGTSLVSLDYTVEYGILPLQFCVPEFRPNYWINVLPYNSDKVRYLCPRVFYDSLKWECVVITKYLWSIAYHDEGYNYKIYIFDTKCKPLTQEAVVSASLDSMFYNEDTSRFVDDCLLASNHIFNDMNTITLYLMF